MVNVDAMNIFWGIFRSAGQKGESKNLNIIRRIIMGFLIKKIAFIMIIFADCCGAGNLGFERISQLIIAGLFSVY